MDSNAKKYILLASLLIGALATGAYFWLQAKPGNEYAGSKPQPASSTAPALTASSSAGAKHDAVLSADGSGRKASPTPEDVQENQALYIDELKDDDFDTLTNEAEVRYGTDPKKHDTDGDGLSDYFEIMVYFTDPKVFDTDSDGHSDGNEVKNKFNPTGPGNLTFPIKPAKR